MLVILKRNTGHIHHCTAAWYQLEIISQPILQPIHKELYLKETAYNPWITNHMYFSGVLIAESVAVEVDITLNETLNRG